MCSLARSYYRGNRTQKSTAITAKLFVFLIDIFSEIHKAYLFPSDPAQRRPPAPPPPACGAGTSGTVRRPSHNTYTYRQSTAFWPPDAPCASPKRAMPCCASCVLRRQSAHGCRSRSWNLYLQAIHNVLFSAIVIPPFSVCRTRTHSGMVSVYAAVFRM